mgnify:CR=1 FL=1
MHARRMLPMLRVQHHNDVTHWVILSIYTIMHLVRQACIHWSACLAGTPFVQHPGIYRSNPPTLVLMLQRCSPVPLQIYTQHVHSA